jgi:hypothetical protein
VILVAFGFYMLLLFRAQVLPVLLLALMPPLLAAPIAAGARSGLWASPLTRLSVRLFIVAFICAAWFFVPILDNRFDYSVLSSTIFEERARYRSISAGSTVLGLEEFDAARDRSMTGLVLLWPGALAFTLFRPVLWEGLTSPVVLAAALENTVLLVWTIAVVATSFTRLRALPKVLFAPWFVTCVLFVAVFGLVVGVSSPNLGTVSRYRLPIIPFYIAALVILESPPWKPRAA